MRGRATSRRATRLKFDAALALAAIVLALALAGAAPARADLFGPISLASVGALQGASTVEQANLARHPVISADGRYVAFEGWFGGVSGIWRRDLLTGAVEQVAGGDAQLPSISANGQYISFTTNEGGHLSEISDCKPVETKLLTGEHPNVYVRDMSQPTCQGGLAPPGAFSLVSAANGSDEPLTYSESEPSSTMPYGAVASGRSAISADGRYVAFVTTAASDLVLSENDRHAQENHQPPPAETPARQVAVRDLQTNETKLVSVEYNNGATEQPVPSEHGLGAVFSVTAFTTGTSTSRPSPPASQGASISADGSTVAWLGQEIDKQAPVLAQIETEPAYTEPLWRRIAGGAAEPTRRVTGGADGPFVPRLNKGEAPVGVFTDAAGSTQLPQLSANGQTVAFLASQFLIGEGEIRTEESETDNLYVADMANGLTSVQALRPLTELASRTSSFPGGYVAITDLAVSPDGSQIAFTTERTAFPLGSPAYVSPPAAQPEMQELFDVDLADDTLTRVTHGYQGENQQSERASASAKEAGSPSFSADGDTLAFASDATNLVYGEGSKASSAFVVSRKTFAAEAAPQLIAPGPASPNTEPAWLLNATAHSRRNGSVLVEVQTPGAGRLSAGAQSFVRVKAPASHVARGGARGRGSHRTRPRTVTTVASRRVASAARSARAEGLVTLVLTLSSRYRALASQRGGLSANVTVALTAPGHHVVRASVPVTFLRSEHKKRPARRGAAKAGGRPAGKARHGK